MGFVASATGKSTHDILVKGLIALARLEHRGAVAADGASSDGVGLMTSVPRELLLKDTGIALADDLLLGVGMLFTPIEETRAEQVLESALLSQGMTVLGWRDVPTRPEVLGEIALSTMPKIRQVLVADASGKPAPMNPDPQSAEYEDSMERRLYLARKQFERAVEAGELTGYVCSLSTTTLVYKSMCLGRLLPEFYSDLAREEYVTRFALFHQR
ncbi:MAG: glutamate synthase large subunit, partial [Bryocella sp.]